MSFRQLMCFFFHIHVLYQSDIPGLGGNRVSKAKMYNFLKFIRTKISKVVMDNFKDISCRIENTWS